MVADELRALAARYKIKVELCKDGAEWLRAGSICHLDPTMTCAISFRRRTVYMKDTHAHLQVVFHEMVHVILGPPSLHLNEGYLLMPFEWELSKLIKAPGFRRLVRSYQDPTIITHCGEKERSLQDFVRARSTEWWAAGISRAHRLGLLELGSPTFKSPKWEGSGVAKFASRWSPDNDHRYA